MQSSGFDPIIIQNEINKYVKTHIEQMSFQEIIQCKFSENNVTTYDDTPPKVLQRFKKKYSIEQLKNGVFIDNYNGNVKYTFMENKDPNKRLKNNI